jgi:lysozyme
MSISQNLVNFIKRYEQFRAESYLPTPNDRPTIGYGCTYHFDDTPVEIGEEISEEQASVDLQYRLDKIYNDLMDRVNFQPSSMLEHRYEAVVSLIDNIGMGNFLSSTTGKLFLSGQDIRDRFGLWNKQAGQVLAGLTNRRIAERKIYTDGDYTG